MNDGDRFHPEFRVKKGFKKKATFSCFFALSTLNEERPTLQKKKNECSLVNVVSSVSSLEKGISSRNKNCQKKGEKIKCADEFSAVVESSMIV